jgi:ATP synthase protein I
VADEPLRDHRRLNAEITEKIGAREKRKLKARGKDKHSIWFGLGMFGVVGWSVAIPTVVGVAIGVWLDSAFPGRISWTLTGLFAGVAVGAMVAWNWIDREGKPD